MFVFARDFVYGAKRRTAKALGFSSARLNLQQVRSQSGKGVAQVTSPLRPHRVKPTEITDSTPMITPSVVQHGAGFVGAQRIERRQQQFKKTTCAAHGSFRLFGARRFLNQDYFWSLLWRDGRHRRQVAFGGDRDGADGDLCQRDVSSGQDLAARARSAKFTRIGQADARFPAGEHGV